MSYNREELLEDLENFLSVPKDIRYEEFIKIINRYKNLNNIPLQSVQDFDNMHSKLLDMLLPDKVNQNQFI
jgi:hypothetical protein